MNEQRRTTSELVDQYARARSALTLGGPAFYTDEGRRERVIICSEAFEQDEHSWRTVAFVDQDGAKYDVHARTLEAADDATWLVAGPKERRIMGAPPLAPFPSARPVQVEEGRGDPLAGVEVRSLTEDQRRRLAEVDALLAEAEELVRQAARTAGPKRKVGDGQRQQARRIMLELQREIAARTAADGTSRYLTELEVLEKGRKGRIEASADRGGGKRLRIRTRAGLQYAWERGDLDGGSVRGDLLYEVGKRYRDAYERAGGLTTPTGAGKAKSTDGRQLGVATALEDLATMRRGMSARQRAVVDQVCGLDMTVRATADQLKAGVPAVRRALRGGLALAAENKRWV